MLKGTLRYHDDSFDVTMFCYAKETGNLQLYLASNAGSVYDDTKMIELFDSAHDGESYHAPTLYGDKSRRLNIKESNGFQTNLQNMLFASRVSAAVRYMYEYNTRLDKANEDNGEEKIFSSKQNFVVTNCETGAQLGTFVKDRGYLCELHLHMPYVDFELEDFDEAQLDAQYLTPLKQKDKFGNIMSITKIKNITFKFDKSLLGFEYISKAKASTSVTSSILGMYETMDDVIEAHPEKSFAWIRDRKYEIVTDETLDEVMRDFDAYDGVIAVDTETSGLAITFKSRIGDADQLTGICMSKEMGTGYYFPLQMRKIKNLCNGDHNYFMQKYKKFFEKHKFVTHNLAFDWKVFYIYDINLNSIFDTMLAYAVTERYKQANFKYGLKELTRSIFGWDMIELSDFIPGAKWGTTDMRFWDLPYELCRQYAPTDADMTLNLYNHIKKIRLLESFKAEQVFEIELKFAKCVAYSEFYGLHIDVDRLPNLVADVENGKAEAEKKLYEIAGETFNANSPKQLQAIMYDKLGLPDVSHKRSTDKEALKELASYENVDGTPLYPFAAQLKKYREYEGLYKTFIKKRAQYISEDGYVHSKVEAFGADTGRVSVNNPNYQSYNDIVKKYVAPRKGFKQWDSDFSQIEYRVLCSMAHEPALIEAFTDPDMDYHTHQAARMFSVPYGAVTKEMRQQCKGINFGLPYGMGDSSLGARIFGKRCQENTIKAADLRERYFVGQDNIRHFFDTVRDEGVQNGYTRTLFGRLRFYHKSVFSEAAIRRQAGNHVIQGCLGGDTLISTLDHGVVKIKDVVNYSGNVWNGEKWTHGDVVYSGKKQKCIVTFANDQKFICSPIHKFLVAGTDAKNENNYIECKDLKRGDLIQYNRNNSLKIKQYALVESGGLIQEVNCIAEADNNVHKLIGETVGLPVLSVEITDEWVDMYDVCNTDDGYYVADGIITHNTAADLFKIACIRVFEMLVANNWLGKVLMDAFIHDEILGEVSEEINYFQFVEEWRKAFEVPVEGFCKLYAGLGIGNSWYEAKKADWTPQFIDAIIHSPLRDSWDCDGERFIKWTKVAYDEYETKRVTDYINENIEKRDTLSQGEKVIKPVIDSYLKAKLEQHIIKENMDNETELRRIAETSGIAYETLIQFGKELSMSKAEMKAYQKAGNSCVKFELQDRLKLFCAWKNIDYTQVDIISADDIEIKTEKPDANAVIEAVDVEVNNMSTDDFMISSVRAFGFLLDLDTSRLILNFDMLNATNTAQKFVDLYGKEAGTYRIYGIMFKPDGTYVMHETRYYIRSSDTLGIQMFLQSVAKACSGAPISV